MKLWAAVGPRRQVVWQTIDDSKDDAVQKMLEHFPGADIKEIAAHGYRCKRITVTVEGES